MRTPMSASFCDSGMSRSIRIIRVNLLPTAPAWTRFCLRQARHGFAIEPADDRYQQLHRLLEIAPIENAVVAVDVPRRHTQRQAGHPLAGDVEAPGIGAAPLDRFELEADAELLRGVR